MLAKSGKEMNQIKDRLNSTNQSQEIKSGFNNLNIGQSFINTSNYESASKDENIEIGPENFKAH